MQTKIAIFPQFFYDLRKLFRPVRKTASGAAGQNNYVNFRGLFFPPPGPVCFDKSYALLYYEIMKKTAPRLRRYTMEDDRKELLRYEKLRTALLGAVLAVLTALLVGAILLAVNLYRYGQRVDRIVERLDTVSEQLEKLDTEKLVQTANALSESLDPEKIEEIVTALDEVSKTLNEVDWASLSESLSEVAASAQERLDDAREALEKLDSVDLDSLNESIAKLKEVIEPLTKFLNPFG